MFCSQCGNSLPDDDRFCTKCGSQALSYTPVESRAFLPGEAHAAPESAVGKGVNGGGAAGPDVRRAPRSDMGAVIVVVLLTIGCFAAYGYYTVHGAGTRKTEAGLFQVPAVSVLHCGEPLVIESCDTEPLPNCRIRNLAQVPLGEIGAWAYDKSGTRIGSGLGQPDIIGLAPGQAVIAKIIPGASGNHPQIDSIILCSVDPQSALGSRRFGIGAKAIP